MTSFTEFTNKIAESGLIPDKILRLGIRILCSQRKKEISAFNKKVLDDFELMLKNSPVALVPDLANEQHYEVPAKFFDYVLGPNRKYSCCYWPQRTDDLQTAEEESLRLTCKHACMEDGLSVLDLGCGWGSLSLWIARNYPKVNITAVSNSNAQRQRIEEEISILGLSNLKVITADMNDFEINGKFDRIVSVEMFEHMRNYEILFKRISKWLTDEGMFFMHIFYHKNVPYEFLDRGPSDWMSRHFFSGGIMPSRNLPSLFQKHLNLESQWDWNGQHYQHTAEAWLKNMDDNKVMIMPLLEITYGKKDAQLWWIRWRIFFLAVSEMFGMNDGREWGVGHYLYRKI